MYTYAWYHWITFFFFYCFSGWIFESAYVSLKSGRFVNRGFLRLPMLPLYGTGAVMMLWVSLPVKNSLLLVYLSGVIAATILEYITGYAMERLFKIRYWDYSNQPFNLHGYICLSSSIAWGVLTILMTEVIHKPVEQLVLGMNPVAEFAFIGITGAMFIADSIQSTREALDLARALEAMTKMRAELEELQVQITLLKAEASQKARELKEEQLARVGRFHPGRPLRSVEIRSRRLMKEARFQSGLLLKSAGSQPGRLLKAAGTQPGRLLKAADTWRETTVHKLTQWRTEPHQKPALPEEFPALTERLKELTENRQRLTRHISFYRKGILRGNPGATSRRFAEALRELRDIVNNR